MSDYIEREAALQALVELIRDKDEVFPTDLTSAIKVISAADVRPVVLCRDCIFRSNDWTGCPKLNGTITGDEFFCKCGIKREET